jgi:hypothetical protein
MQLKHFWQEAAFQKCCESISQSEQDPIQVYAEKTPETSDFQGFSTFA